MAKQQGVTVDKVAESGECFLYLCVVKVELRITITEVLAMFCRIQEADKS